MKKPTSPQTCTGRGRAEKLIGLYTAYAERNTSAAKSKEIKFAPLAIQCQVSENQSASRSMRQLHIKTRTGDIVENRKESIKCEKITFAKTRASHTCLGKESQEQKNRIQEMVLLKNGDDFV